MGTAIVGRFAPSPSGRMHLGNVMCALLSWLDVKSMGGEWRLRIEDIDVQRCRREYAMRLMDDLTWLGLEWDGDVVWQSERGDIYKQCLDQLTGMGLTYHCNCSRNDLMAASAPHEADGRRVYPGTCRGKGLSEGAVRIRVPVSLEKICGDFIVQRRDGAWAYQLAVVVDDALMGITRVVRGRDLETSVPQQGFLYDMLGFGKPVFVHHPLLCNAEGLRLCKRDKSMDMGVLREMCRAEEIIGFLAFRTGLIPEEMPMAADDLLSVFSWDRITKEDIRIRQDFPPGAAGLSSGNPSS
ncbi:MAG: tRNA glutamyl-Q(34) synthetase GluQRS [Bacteroidaceae bacterium]|nr:tRNA glutamyl-Q(34) synthetase GluQRS [Bacteroidaceae bacterium]